MSTSQVFSSASLYVGDLAKGVTEGLLFEVFNNVGPVASIRVCRHSVTKDSLGYGYVNFHNPADAERAIDQLNFTPILDKPCRIMWSQRDPAKRKSGAGNIFIKNLDKSINTSALYDTFSAFGRIVSCKVEVDNKGVSKGYGFVAYETQEEADKAIARVNGMMIADKIVFVGPFLPKKARDSDKAPAYTNIYVKNLDGSVTKEDLEKLFSECGKVTSCAIMQNENNESKGFGFVNFEKPEEAHNAVEKLNGTEVNGKPLFVGKAQKKEEREEELNKQRAEQLSKVQGSNVYVKNLDDTITEDMLRQEFSKFGSVSSARVMCDDKGNSKGFGFVLFSNPEEAAKAIGETNGVLFGSKPLYASLAQRKEVRHAQLAAQHQQKLNMMQLGMMNGMRGLVPFPGAPGTFFPMGAPGRMGYPPQQMAPRPPRFVPQQQQQQQQRGFQSGAGVGQRMSNRPRFPRAPPAQPSQSPQIGQSGSKPRSQNAQGQQLNKNYKYTATARNQPENEAPEDQETTKQNVGEQLYALIINKTTPTLAGKITGMLLESHSVPELNEFIRTPAALDGKIAEAMDVLQAHQVGESDAQVAPLSV